MPDVPFSYGYQNKVRDVSDILMMIAASMPRLISIVGTSPRRPKQHKHEWPEITLSPESTTLDAAIASVNTTELTVKSKLPFTLNTIARFEGKDELLRVVAISDAQEKITVVRGYGDTTKVANVAKDTSIVVVTKPKNESTPPDHKGDGRAPDLNHNFTEIFDAEAVVSLSQGNVYGVGDPNSNDPVGDMMDWQVAIKLKELLRYMNNALIYGRRVARTATTPGTMGGILQFHEGSANNVNAAGAAISKKLLGDAFQKAFEGGADGLDTLLCGPTQARNISGLYSDKLVVVRENRELGEAIYQVRGDMPIEGFITTIVVEPNFPSTKISVFAKERLQWAVMRAMQDKDSTPNGADFVARRIIGEYTAELNAWAQTASLIENLSDALAAA